MHVSYILLPLFSTLPSCISAQRWLEEDGPLEDLWGRASLDTPWAGYASPGNLERRYYQHVPRLYSRAPLKQQGGGKQQQNAVNALNLVGQNAANKEQHYDKQIDHHIANNNAIAAGNAFTDSLGTAQTHNEVSNLVNSGKSYQNQANQQKSTAENTKNVLGGGSRSSTPQGSPRQGTSKGNQRTHR